jgi:hypothetical protein
VHRGTCTNREMGLGNCHYGQFQQGPELIKYGAGELIRRTLWLLKTAGEANV